MALAGAPSPKRPRASNAKARPVAAERPIARVVVDLGLPHLDRAFDYLVPAAMAADAVPGARVRVKFAGADHDGFIVERADNSEHAGRLSPLRRVVSAEPVLSPELNRLARSVADRYAGTLADVLRLAIPPRHAATEKEPSPAAAAPPQRPAPGAWAAHLHGAALLDAVARDGSAPRAVWSPMPTADWSDLLARLIAAALSAGRGAVVVVPDGRDTARLDAALQRLIGADHHVVLGAELGPAERYRRWLRVLRGSVRAAIGTRSAAFAPVHDLGLVAIWDDGDDLHAEPRAPYPHMREVLLLRAHQAGAAAVVGGFARSAEAQLLLETGWAQPVEPDRATARQHAPHIHTSGDDYEQARDEAARSARLPSLAWRVTRAGLDRGPVLVQVARAGYLPAMACARCRAPALCASCGAALRLTRPDGAPECEACGTVASAWRCSECGHDRLRAGVVGVRRTAEELGRAFPEVPIVVSRGGGRTAADEDIVRDEVGPEPALVVATHGAEPVPSDGYAAALLLDGTSMLNRPGLRAGEEALRRWMRAAALVRSRSAGGEVVVVAEPSAPAVQALVRWDPGGFAIRELSERSQLHFPPAARVAELRGAQQDVDELLSLAELPEIAEVLGPAPIDDVTVQAIVRVPRAAGTGLAASLRAAAGVRSARRSGESVRVRIDPVDLS
ncbi:primosomal protein N' [Phytoactinopolyspora halotolerans]|uniref:Probable replication restart protein PriA n=1 Tax=Phytoactinopolyspora halotolerans TaxID=1981512 RepID=A0A6L9SG10_9ACTN|nr:primosomal protein N' [Phytoactinopolyspora halotolerans]